MLIEKHQQRRPSIQRVGMLPFKTFQYLLLLLTGSCVVALALQTVRFLPVTGDNIYPESAFVLAAQRWAHGSPLYSDYRQSPYLMTAFPPVWYAVLAMGAKLGLSDLDSLTLFGRVLSIICLLAAGALGWFWNRWLGFPALSALLTPAFFLSFPILVPWAVTARPDTLALFLSMGALYCAGLRPGILSVSLAGVMAAGAFLVKNNTVAAAVAIVLWLFLSGKRKRAAVFCSVWGAVVVALLLPFHLSGDFVLLLNLSGAKFGLFASTYIRDVLAKLLTKDGHGHAVALFAWGAFSFFQSLHSRDARLRLIRIYLVVSGALAFIGSAAAGGGVNHYLEPAFAMALLVPAGMARLEAAWDTNSACPAFAATMMIALLAPSLDVQRSNAIHRSPEDLRAFATLVKGRRVFTDDPYLAARTPAPQAVDLSSLTNTEKRGGWAAWSSEAIEADLNARRYELVILRTPMRAPYVPYNPDHRYPRTHRLDGALQNAVLQNYHLCFESDESDEYGRLYVYSPLPAERNGSADRCPLLRQSWLDRSSPSTLSSTN
jgi:hypothetical protein